MHNGGFNRVQEAALLLIVKDRLEAIQNVEPHKSSKLVTTHLGYAIEILQECINDLNVKHDWDSAPGCFMEMEDD
jgi:hypothetical protein